MHFKAASARDITLSTLDRASGHGLGRGENTANSPRELTGWVKPVA